MGRKPRLTLIIPHLIKNGKLNFDYFCGSVVYFYLFIDKSIKTLGVNMYDRRSKA
nr:MAG TPA: hypothetical protein [Caudoviricetes sp.]